MDMTLDQYLAEVDRWKQAVTDRMLTLSPDERAEEDRQARAWLEARIGRRLRDTPQMTLAGGERSSHVGPHSS